MLGVVAYCVGLIARRAYILDAHHPRNHVYSDGMPITALAELLVDPNGRQQFFHTLWPPGTSAFFALNLIYDPTLGSAAAWQFVLSSAVPLIVAHTARLAWGPRAGWIALTMSALHFGFIHYGGFFLAEQLFQFAVVVAVWTTVAALVMGRWSSANDSLASSATVFARWRVLSGVVCGLAWALAYSFRPNALPVALFVGLWMSARWLRRRQRDALLGLAGGLLGLLVVMVPLTSRCTSLLGHFCPGSSNSAMNLALGHAPDVAGLYFRPRDDQPSAGMNYWYPPARAHHGYVGTAVVPTSLYDTGRVLSWVADRFVEHPFDFLVVSLGNALDLFGFPYWPEDYALLPARRATILKQLFLVFVLVPGLAMWGLNVRRMTQKRELGDVESLFTAVIFGMFVVAAASLGEARYRIPFDTVLIALAARAYTCNRVDRDVLQPQARSLRYSVAATGLGIAMATTLLTATAMAEVRLAARISPFVPKRNSSAPLAGMLSLSDIDTPRPDGTPWDAPGNFHLHCTPTCSELRIALGGMQHSPTIEVSADHNDRYQVIFYKNDVPVGQVAWGVFEGADGLRVVQSNVPPSALAAGYDMLGVRPLYGDGRYSIGHVKLL
ncbi:MAG: hypothetical protein M3O46_09505 [Myxococcota bacterium]|nr:hypothetical protein [Myxococcota bacterium]